MFNTKQITNKCKKNISPHFISIMKDVGKSAEKTNQNCKIVGGVVRDCILGSQNDDLDFVCNDVDKIANDLIKRKKAKDIGVKTTEKYKTKILIMGKGKNKEKIDLVEPRKEIYTKDSIKPIVVKGDFQTDALRRDFTINTLRIDVNPSKWFNIDDPTGKGLSDLQNKILRTPLHPDKTFEDDPTRMLRGVRFAACKNMKLDDNVIKSIKKNKNQIKRVPSELIHKELMKGMACDNYFRIMDKVQLLEKIIPEVTQLKGIKQLKTHHTEDAFNHTLNYIDYLPDNSIFKLTGLLHDIGKVDTNNNTGHFYEHEKIAKNKINKIMSRLKFSKNEINRVNKLVESHMALHLLDINKITEKGLRKFIKKYDEILPELEIMSRADINSDNPNKTKAIMNLNNKMIKIEETKNKMKNIINNKFKLEINGNDIKNMGIKGKNIGIIKSNIENKVIEGTLKNKRKILLKEINNEIKKLKIKN